MVPESRTVLINGMGYLISCSLLLVANKLCVQHVPAPAFVHVVQFLAAAATVLGLHWCRAADVDSFVWAKVSLNIIYVGVSSSAMYFNMCANSICCSAHP